MTLLSAGSFELPTDGWYQIAGVGDFPHRQTNLTQVLDLESCAAMAEAFKRDASAQNFPGVLIDFDHDSLNPDKRSEAAGWISALEARPTGLWAQIRWSDEGAKSVTGGRYRFISPVWRQDECADLGNSKVRPLHLINAGLTNDPNISGMVPLSNKNTPATAPTLILGSVNHSRLFRTSILVNAGPIQSALPCSRVPIRTLANTGRGAMSDEERKAMFARLHGGESSSGGGERSIPAPDQPAPDHNAPATEPTAPQAPDDETPTYDYTTRESEARNAALQKERDFIIGLNPGPAPEPRTFEKIDLRAMEKAMLQSGMPLMQIESEIAALEQKNRDRQNDYRKIKNLARSKVTKKKSFKVALATELDKIKLRNERDAAEYGKYKERWDKELARVDASIEDEKISAKEYDNKMAIKIAEQAEKDLSKAEREKRAAQRAAEAAADKERIRKDREARAAAKAAEEAEDLANPVKAFQRKDKNTVTYWTALKAGDIESASKIFPTANHEANIQYLQDTAAENNSSKALTQAEKIFKETKHQDPLEPRG
jgi:hypothetical protein